MEQQGTMSGRQTVVMDGRNRISFPSGFRAVIGDWLFISPDQSERNYLVVRSEAGYNAELDRVEKEARALWEGELPELIQDAAEDARRDFGGSTIKVSPDKNGRITISDELKQYAGFSDHVVVVGVGAYAELWDEEKLNKHLAERAEERKRRRAQLDAAKRARLAGEREA